MKKIITIIFFYALSVLAQDSLILPSVEITAIRTGIHEFLSYNSAEKIEIQKGEIGLSLTESLNKIPGLIVSNRNNPSMGDKISIRGIGSRAAFGVRGIKILADNIPLTLPDGQSQTNNIDLSSAGKIEILKGPSSALYGNSSGGVINISSETPDSGKINLMPQVIIGENDLKKYLLKLSGIIDAHSYAASLNYTAFRGFREHSSQKSYRINTVYKNVFSDKFKITTILNYFNSPYLLNPGSIDKESLLKNRHTAREFIKQQGAGEKLNQTQIGTTINYLLNDINIESTLYYVNRNLINPIPGRIIDLKRNAGGLRLMLKSSFLFNDFNINLYSGFDIELQYDLRREYENNGLSNINIPPGDIFKNLLYGLKIIAQDESVISAGPFISSEFLFDNLGVQIGLRYDKYIFKVDDNYTDNSGSSNMDQLNPSIGLYFKPNIYSKLYINYTSSFQTPTTSELSNREDGLGGFNEALRPEKVFQFEVGTEYFFDNINLIVNTAAYILSFNNLLIPYQIMGSEEVFYRNAGKAQNTGFELIFGFKPKTNLSTFFSYSYMNFIYKDYRIDYNGNIYQLDLNKVPGIPKQRFSLEITYQPEAGIWGKTKVQWTDKMYVNDFNTTPPGSSPSYNYENDSFLDIDFRLGYLVETDYLNADIFFGINNLMNTEYAGSIIPNAAGERYYEPAPGRNWYLGLNIQI